MPNRGPEPTEPRTNGAAPSNGKGGAHVLVVDDHGVVREFLADVLRASGHRVTLAASGDEAMEVARKDPPDVLLTDLSMRGMDGQELIRRMREDHPAVVPVVITGFGTVQRTVDLMRLGAFDVLTKPCAAGEIGATVAKALEHHDALRLNGDLRERLRVQEKLAMIGKLAAGGAHGLNNLTEAAMQLMGDSEDNCPRWQDGVHTYDRKICRQLKDPQIGLHLSVSGYGGVVLKRG